MSGQIPNDVKAIVEQFTCDYAHHLRELVQLDMALAIAADRKARERRPTATTHMHPFEDAIACAEAAGLTELVNEGRMQPCKEGDA